MRQRKQDRVSTLFVCVTCRREGDPPADVRPGARLYAALKEQAGDLDVQPVECLSNCTRSCTAAVAAPGKWTYVVGHLDPDQHVSDMVQFAHLHQASPDGLTVWRDRPVHVRKNTIARVPPMTMKGSI
jgi:predicted metal-binding protein